MNKDPKKRKPTPELVENVGSKAICAVAGGSPSQKDKTGSGAPGKSVQQGYY